MKTATAAIATVALALGVATVALADDEATSLSYISYLERYATLRPAGDGESLEAQINMPVLSGDRLETSRGARVEVQLADGSTLWVDEFTTVDFDALAFSRDEPVQRTALYVADGSVGLEVPAAGLGEGTTRVETPAGVVFLRRPGLYRLDLDRGQLHTDTFEGLAELPAGVGSTLLRPGEQAWFGAGNGEIQKAALSEEADDFWAWVQDRRHPQVAAATAQYLGADASPRTAILDSYGDWVYVPSFSTWMWRPRVSVGWVPYSYGRWYWTPIGWNWISYEPWGWYPSHYGSWYFDVGFGWVWGWDRVWGPAWVHWIYTPGYVGWCPRGYYDWWYTRRYAPHAGRWARTTLDFSGRVRLRDIDPRPWTIVRAGEFGNAHVDRVRLDAGHVLRGIAGDRDGYVRSGPLLTTSRSGGAAESLFADRYRTARRDVPALDSLLGRSGKAANPGSGDVLSLRRSETVDLARSPVRSPVQRTAPRERPVALVERSSAIRSREGVTTRSPVVQQRTGGGSGRAAPRRSAPVAPPATSRSSTAPPPGRARAGSPNTGRPSTPPRSQAHPPAHQADPPARPRGSSSATPRSTARPSNPGSGRISASREARPGTALPGRVLRFPSAERSAQSPARRPTTARPPTYRAPTTTPRGSTLARPFSSAPRGRVAAPRAIRPTAPSVSRPSSSRAPARSAPRVSAPRATTPRFAAPRTSAPSRPSARPGTRSQSRATPRRGGSSRSKPGGQRH